MTLIWPGFDVLWSRLFLGSKYATVRQDFPAREAKYLVPQPCQPVSNVAAGL